jgi:glucodextranase-like protein
VLPKLLLAAAVAAVVTPAAADAAITRSSVLTPAGPHYRLYTIQNKEVDAVDVSGMTDGFPGDLVDIVCDDVALKRDVAVDEAGRFAARIALAAFPTRECTIRALPYKLRPKDVRAFDGPRAAITRFNPELAVVPVREGRELAVRDYAVETGPARLNGAGAKALGTDVWQLAGAIKAVTVDGRDADLAADVPLLEIEGRPAAPGGYAGVHATVRVDERTNEVTVTETEPVVTCDDKCLTVDDTGVALVRTVAFTEHHAVSEVRDQWISTDGRAHRIRLVALHGTPSLWRFPGSAGFAAYRPGQSVPVSGPGTILTRDGAGSLAFDPAPAAFAFADADLLEDALDVTTPSTVLRTFTAGDVTIADRRGAPSVTIDGPRTGSVLTQPSAVVFGRASDNVGVAALTVNGRAATLEADGTFKAAVDLPLGTSRITVVATDGARQQATATTDVTVVEVLSKPQPTVRGCRVPSVKRGATLKSVKAKLRKANCTYKVAKRRSKVKKGRVIGLTRTSTRVLIRVSRGR